MPKQFTKFLTELAELLDKHNVTIENTVNRLCFKFQTKLYIEEDSLTSKKLHKMLNDIEKKRG